MNEMKYYIKKNQSTKIEEFDEKIYIYIYIKRKRKRKTRI